MKNIQLIIIILFIFSYDLYSKSGNSGISFLKLSAGGRANAMGESFALDVGNPSGIHFNPATIALSKNIQLSFSHMKWIQDTRLQFIGGVFPSKNFCFGVSFITSSVSNIHIRKVPGEQLGTFTSRNLAAGFSSAYRLENLYLGLSGKFLYEKIFIDDASGYAVDLGILYKTPLNVFIAFSTNNLGKMSELRKEAIELPTSIRFSASKSFYLQVLNSKITGTSDFVRILPEKKNHLHSGGEFLYNDLLAFRIGILTGYTSRFFTSGLGFKYKGFEMDYSYIPSYNNFGSTQTISITLIL